MDIVYIVLQTFGMKQTKRLERVQGLNVHYITYNSLLICSYNAYIVWKQNVYACTESLLIYLND